MPLSKVFYNRPCSRRYMSFRYIALHSPHTQAATCALKWASALSHLVFGLLFKHWRLRRAICENYAKNTSRPPNVTKLQLIGMVEWFVCGWQVKLCYPTVTHEPYVGDEVLRDKRLIIKRY